MSSAFSSASSSNVSYYEDEEFKVARIVTSKSDSDVAMEITNDTPIKKIYSESGQKILLLREMDLSDGMIDFTGKAQVDRRH